MVSSPPNNTLSIFHSPKGWEVASHIHYKEASLGQETRFLIDWGLHSRDGLGAPVPWLSSWGISEEETGEAASFVRP